MRKCLALYFEKGFNKAYHSKLVKDLFVQCRKGLNPTYQYPKQVFERIAPGKFIRNYTKETLRRADRTKIREIVSAIFLKKQIKAPPRMIKAPYIPRKNLNSSLK